MIRLINTILRNETAVHFEFSRDAEDVPGTRSLATIANTFFSFLPLYNELEFFSFDLEYFQVGQKLITHCHFCFRPAEIIVVMVVNGSYKSHDGSFNSIACLIIPSSSTSKFASIH